jgi:hypothetical protein
MPVPANVGEHITQKKRGRPNAAHNMRAKGRPLWSLPQTLQFSLQVRELSTATLLQGSASLFQKYESFR